VVDLGFFLSFLCSEVSLVDVFGVFLALALTIVIGVIVIIVILVIFFLDPAQSTSSPLLSALLWNGSPLSSLLIAPALLLLFLRCSAGALSALVIRLISA